MDLLQLNKTSNGNIKLVSTGQSTLSYWTKHSIHEYIRPVGLAGRETKPTTLKEQHAHRIITAKEAFTKRLHPVSGAISPYRR